MSCNVSPNLIVMKISEEIDVQFFYYIRLWSKDSGVAVGIGATFRTEWFWCSTGQMEDFQRPRRLLYLQVFSRLHFWFYETKLEVRKCMWHLTWTSRRSLARSRPEEACCWLLFAKHRKRVPGETSPQHHHRFLHQKSIRVNGLGCLQDQLFRMY